MRVMCTSEMARRCSCSALFAILGAVARAAVGREAIVAGGEVGSQAWAAMRRCGTQSIDVDVELHFTQHCTRPGQFDESRFAALQSKLRPTAAHCRRRTER